MTNYPTKKLSLEEIKTNVRRMVVVSHYAHSLYKEFWFLRSRKMVGQIEAEKNVRAYKNFGYMFSTFEESSLIAFTVIFSQLFDNRSDVISLYNLNIECGQNYKSKIDNLKKSKEVESIIKLRHKFFAHKDNTGKHNNRIVLSSDSIEGLYRQICDLYGEITGEDILIHDTSADELHSVFDIVREASNRKFNN